MSKTKSNALTMLAMAALMSEGSSMMFTGSGEDNARVFLPKEPQPPKGTKEYFFNSVGDFSTEKMLKTETVFKCYAINDKNAIRKFKRWEKVNE
jgi:hypothetical protein